MRAPVGVQRRRGIGRPPDGGQDRAIRTSRVGNASRRPLVGINHLVSPVPSQTSRLSRRDRPGFHALADTLRSNRGDRVSTKTENGPGDFPSVRVVNRARYLLCFRSSAKFLAPCVVLVREVSHPGEAALFWTAPAASRRTCRESSGLV